jgi:hypothetical protein
MTVRTPWLECHQRRSSKSLAGIAMTPTVTPFPSAVSNISRERRACGPPVIRLTFVGAMSCSRNQCFKLNAMA